MVYDISIYRQRLNLENATFTLIEHEDAIVATVYKVTLTNGLNYILKISLLARHYEREFYFLNYFRDNIPVPHIIDHVPPENGIHGAILMECMPGNVLKKEELTPSLAFTMGELLAQIHLIRTAGYGDLTKPEALTSSAREPFISKFQQHLAECTSHLPQNIVKQCEQYLEDNVSLLDSVDGPCIVHWDFRPGNIMVHNGKIQGTIDWSSSRSDFAEEDFCSMEHSGWARDPDIKKSFLTGYASIRPVPEYAKIMLLLRLSKALASMGFTIRTHTWAGKNAAFYHMNRAFVEKNFL